MTNQLPDLQHGAEVRGLAIQEVGVAGVKTPVSIDMRDGSMAPSVASVDLTVSLPASERGTHMSRFVEALQDGGPLKPARIRPLLETLLHALKAQRVRLRMALPLFLPRLSPVTGKPCFAVHEARFACELRQGTPEPLCLVGVQALATTLCPCSKAISKAGAHNQRSLVTVWVEECHRQIVWFEELVDIVEQRGASAPIFPLLKREDEKWATERAYDNPRFVEDVVREVALGLEPMRSEQAGQPARAGWYRVEARNQESIHAHDAYARIESGECPLSPVELG